MENDKSETKGQEVQAEHAPQHSPREGKQGPKKAHGLQKKVRNKPKKKTQKAQAPKTPPSLTSEGEHALHTPWTFWYSKKDPKETNFESTLHRLGTCGTIEEFFRLYSRMKRPHELAKDSNVQLFRSDVTPMWENYPTGGMWALHMKRHSPLLDRLWEQLLIATIGEAFEEPDVLGVALHIRPKEDALYLWHADASLRNVLAEKLKAVMQLPSTCPMEYRSNKFSIERRVSNAAQKHEEEEKKH